MDASAPFARQGKGLEALAVQGEGRADDHENFTGQAPELAAGAEMVLENGIRKGDPIAFEVRDGNAFAIRTIGPDFEGEAYLVDPQSSQEDLILVRVESASMSQLSQGYRIPSAFRRGPSRG